MPARADSAPFGLAERSAPAPQGLLSRMGSHHHRALTKFIRVGIPGYAAVDCCVCHCASGVRQTRDPGTLAESRGWNMAGSWTAKQEICEIGRRIYARQFAAGNDGNISCRLSDDLVLCTPTQICKGFMTPEDLCTVDMQGKQRSGQRKCTSEVLLHLEIYKADPNVRAVVHCHPPHATAFGVARVDIPSCVLPEVEVFLGVVPRADYEDAGRAGLRRHRAAIHRPGQYRRPQQPRDGELGPHRGAGLLVHGNPRRLLPGPLPGQPAR